MVRAEGDDVVPPRAGRDARGVVVRVGVGLGAGRLEDLRVGRRLAGLWVPKAPRAAVPRRVEREAGALAGHDTVVVTPDLESHWAHRVQVAHATCIAAFPSALEWRDGDGEIVAIDEADIVEVLVVA